MHAIASAVAAAAPRKALLLHGSSGSAGAFVSRGAAPFIYACKGRYRDGGPDAWEFEALDADIVGGARSAGCGAWWTYPAGQRSFTADSYEGDLESICAVEAALEAGRIPALVGFSQGAMLAAIVAARAALGESSVPLSCLQLVVCCGGAMPNPHAPLLRRLKETSPPSLVPTLHCLSKVDRINPPEQGEALAACFGATAEVLWHDGGHVMPPRPQLLEAAEFLDRHWSVGGRPASAAEEEITMF